VEGPAIIEQLDSTILVPPGLKAKVESSLTIVIDVPLAQG
jgi:N-methylhydantoinase A